ncbi:hypothetical protein WJX74_008797 [Apatococcus lobatus]|uniref:Large ribosomal subunit protein uL4c n=1 Tax=Apatococcus lobatus TaxID=904363 RepID=A0AAW1RLS1_9CHLO
MTHAQVTGDRLPQLFQPRAAITATPAPLDVKNFDGGAAGSAELSLKVAPPPTAKGLVHRYITYVLQNARAGTASTKTRAEVRGGGKKPFQQKKTGNARAGSRTTPLKPGGGVIFGPKPRDWSIRMNKKERRLALSTALQSASDSITIIEDIGEKLGAPKTKELLGAMQRWGVSPTEKALLILDRPNQQVELAGRNVAKLHLNTADTLEVFRILNADRIIIERSALNYIHDFYGSKQLPIDEEAAPEAATPAAEIPAEAPVAASEAAAAEAPADAVAEGADSPLAD